MFINTQLLQNNNYVICSLYTGCTYVNDSISVSHFLFYNIFLASSESKQPIHVMDYPARVSNMHSNDGQLFSVEYLVTNAAFSH